MTWDQNPDQSQVMADAEGSRLLNTDYDQDQDQSGGYQGAPNYDEPQSQMDPSGLSGGDMSGDYSGDGGTGWQDDENQPGLSEAQFDANNPEAGTGIG
jgi:hypothetical protein